MYNSELDIMEQHNWTEGAKYIQFIKLNLVEEKDEDEIRKIIVDDYKLMKPKEFTSKWNRFQFIKRKVDEGVFNAR